MVEGEEDKVFANETHCDSRVNSCSELDMEQLVKQEVTISGSE